ncbi:homeobox-leucine zipper protein ROC2 [Striga asiatica]|uniref:Homeobox-leucine zipper protein ROC2 n=1 Tax=Striga asiatica TaxID=4170 RepID=A0A5A7PQD1_STRAF|nr:homeobox-leucine zipper protein ROC2 [Striga asiatica]
MSGDDQVPIEVDEDIENKSGGKNIEMTQNRPKRRRYNRHTPQQIQAMEGFFREYPHPDNNQRDELSKELEMEPSQVKFWFQNKRTQMKTKHHQEENARLRAENERLGIENKQYKEALSNACCPACGRMAATGDVLFDDCHLRVENAKLREEINRISKVASNYVGRPFTRYTAMNCSSALGNGPFYKGSTSKSKELSVEKKDCDEPQYMAK